MAKNKDDLTTNNSYETPQTRSQVRKNQDSCPVCGDQMERGHLHSSSDIRWVKSLSD